MSGPPSKYFKAIEKNATAREIIDAERRQHEAKTARLREARVAKEAIEAEKPPTKKIKKIGPKAKTSHGE